jgi:hypothetical protein
MFPPGYEKSFALSQVKADVAESRKWFSWLQQEASRLKSLERKRSPNEEKVIAYFERAEQAMQRGDLDAAHSELFDGIYLRSNGRDDREAAIQFVEATQEVPAAEKTNIYVTLTNVGSMQAHGMKAFLECPDAGGEQIRGGAPKVSPLEPSRTLFQTTFPRPGIYACTLTYLFKDSRNTSYSNDDVTEFKVHFTVTAVESEATRRAREAQEQATAQADALSARGLSGQNAVFYETYKKTMRDVLSAMASTGLPDDAQQATIQRVRDGMISGGSISSADADLLDQELRAEA